MAAYPLSSIRPRGARRVYAHSEHVCCAALVTSEVPRQGRRGRRHDHVLRGQPSVVARGAGNGSGVVRRQGLARLDPPLRFAAQRGHRGRWPERTSRCVVARRSSSCGRWSAGARPPCRSLGQIAMVHSGGSSQRLDSSESGSRPPRHRNGMGPWISTDNSGIAAGSRARVCSHAVLITEPWLSRCTRTDGRRRGSLGPTRRSPRSTCGTLGPSRCRTRGRGRTLDGRGGLTRPGRRPWRGWRR